MLVCALLQPMGLMTLMPNCTSMLYWFRFDARLTPRQIIGTVLQAMSSVCATLALPAKSDQTLYVLGWQPQP